jgi:hypothetical protein
MMMMMMMWTLPRWRTDVLDDVFLFVACEVLSVPSKSSSSLSRRKTKHHDNDDFSSSSPFRVSRRMPSPER